ncbi:MAG TPA: CU044_5270 family protein [Streptosporangiaceae bacterium]|nr:CU044_5270 family protein [Streptosporangiaceae bacterium]
MTDLPEPGPVRELKDLRADVAGRAPEELHRARGLLIAEIQAERGAGDSSHPAFLPPGASRPRLAMFGGVAAAVIATATAIAMVLLPPPARPLPPSAPPTGSAGPGVPQASSSAVLTAAYVLNQAASAAAASSRPVPRPGQVIYVTSVTTYVSSEILRSGKEKSWLYRTRRQIWQSVDGQRAGLLQIVDRGNVKLPWGPVPPAASGQTADWISLPASSCPGAAPAHGTYAFLASLPTSPGSLRAWLYQHPDGRNQADAQAWTDIGDMLREMLVPPKLAAALFRVAGTIPGATVVPHVTNAVGRAGVAVSRSGMELIFDPKTYQLIGEGGVLTKATPGVGPAGTVIASTAQLKEAVVDHLPKVPPSRVDKSGGGVTC